MRKIVVILFFVMSACNCFAQIPNSGFENWVDSPKYSFPTGWTSYDWENFGGGADSATVFKSSMAKSGNFAAMLRICGSDTSSYPYGNAARLDLGIDLGQLVNMPFTQWISKISFWTKYHLVGNDSLTALVFLQDSSLGYIGSCQVALKRDTSDYILAQGDFEVSDTTAKPAYLTIIFIIGVDVFGQFSVGHIGSWALIDDLELSLSTGVNEVLHSEQVKIIPNPSSDILNIFIAPKFTNSVIKIFDIQGRLIHEGIETKVDVSGFNKGIYLIQISNSSGTIMNKFLVE